MRNKRPEVENWGTGTDPDFYEGLIMGLKELGLKKFSFAEANLYYAWHYRGFMDIHERHGVEMNEPEQRFGTSRANPEVVWSTVPDAVVYKRIPHYAPVNEPRHLAAEHRQVEGAQHVPDAVGEERAGLGGRPYVRFCPGWKMVTGVPDFMKEHIAPNAEPRVQKYFDNHRSIGYARYEVPGRADGARRSRRRSGRTRPATTRAC